MPRAIEDVVRPHFMIVKSLIDPLIESVCKDLGAIGTWERHLVGRRRHHDWCRSPGKFTWDGNDSVWS